MRLTPAQATRIEAVIAIESSGRQKEFVQIISDRIVSLRHTIARPEIDIMLKGLVEETLKLNLDLYMDLTGENFDKRYS